jgi:uncharacterized membrane protein YfhO
LIDKDHFEKMKASIEKRLGEIVDADMVFSTTVTLDKPCTRCLVILKQSYHPNWKATVNGKEVKPINVMPFFAAVPVTEAGTYKVTMWYEPSSIKKSLLSLSTSVTVFISLILSLAAYNMIRERISKEMDKEAHD